MHSRTNSQNSLSTSSEEEVVIARLNEAYDLMKVIGKGSTAKVWLARSVENPSQQFAIKIMSAKYMKLKHAAHSIRKEIEILKSLDHKGVIGCHQYGDDGVVNYDGQTYTNQVYIVMEYVEGPLLFDMCKQLGNVGEDFGRYFAKQMIEQLEYMNDNGIVHRDIKLENILMDKEMNLKLADFGFATNKHIEELTSFRGTQSYMAPEIRKQQKYNGKQTDIFSMGVVLFTLIVGYFPFSTADLKDQFYTFLLQGERDANGINSAYWETLKASDLSYDFKDLMQKIFSMDGDKRPTLEEIKNHPWYKNKIDDQKEEELRQ